MLERNQNLKAKIQSSAISITAGVSLIQTSSSYEPSVLDDIKDHLYDIFDTIGATYPNALDVTRKNSATYKRHMKNEAVKATITTPDALREEANKELSALTDDELTTLYLARMVSVEEVPHDIAKKLPAFM